MKSSFYLQIENSTAHRHSRDELCEVALSNTEALTELFLFAFDLKNKIHFKACWALELVLEKDINLLISHLTTFVEKVKLYHHDSALRSISKICLFISKSSTIQLTDKQEQILIETCLDWLIQEEKVATKAYAIRALYNFSKKKVWIKEELRTILEQDYSSHSAAYKAVAKEVLKKINNEAIVK
ncbi:hypothetical protein [Flavobacterium sp. J27]|uniref:hypothetical protein n=1 Tax=Flavobacterium sp. J27 TaxID=2060419 RepID=UPI00102F9EFC|nr:hypothetical protein [Flavobacterium sp. J27]